MAISIKPFITKAEALFKESRTFSSKLVNYKTMEMVDGVKKTAFYTELNTNYSVGDKLFVVGGNYDTDLLLKTNKFSKNVNGYKILKIDGCKITLDIDWDETINVREEITPSQYKDVVYVEVIENLDQFYHLNNSLKEVEVLNTETIYNTTIANINNKSKYRDSSNALNRTHIAYFNGVGTYSNGFYVAAPSTSQHYYGSVQNDTLKRYGFYQLSDWTKLKDFKNNKLSTSSANTSYGFNKLSFSKDVQDTTSTGGTNVLFRAGLYYSFNGKEWVLDVPYCDPYVSKTNFRNGLFAGKRWKDGIFGSYNGGSKWTSGTWENGIFLLSEWYSGDFNSESDNYKQVTNYTKYENGNISFYSDKSNNRGIGYNYSKLSKFYSGTIKNGLFDDSIFCGMTNSPLDIYYGATNSMSLTIKDGVYNSCLVKYTNVDQSNLTKSKLKYSYVQNSSLYDADLENSVVKKSDLKSIDQIKIESVDFSYYVVKRNTGPGSNGASAPFSFTYKFYISNADYLKIKNFDKLNIHNIIHKNNESPFNFFEKIDLTMGSFKNYKMSGDWINGDIFVSVSKSNEKENSHLNRVYFTTSFPRSVYNKKIVNYNSNKCSIDVTVTSESLNWTDLELDLNSVVSDITEGLVNVSNYRYALNNRCTVTANFDHTNAYITFGDIKSAIIDECEISGLQISSRKDLMLTNNGLGYELCFEQLTPNYIHLFIDKDIFTTYQDKKYEPFRIGDHLYINDIIGNDGLITEILDGDYIITDLCESELSSSYTDLTTVPRFGVYTDHYAYRLEKIGGYTFSFTNNVYRGVGFFESTNETPLNNNITRLVIKNSSINSGVYRGVNFVNSKFENELFNNADRTITLSNINNLKFKDLLLNNINNNTINNGFYFNTWFKNITFNNGVIYKSEFRDSEFKNGVFKTSAWMSSTFSMGAFIDSRTGVTTYYAPSIHITPDYSYAWTYYRWQGGTFLDGEFVNSAWMYGTFKNGHIYNSTWMDGEFQNGIFGNISFSKDISLFYKGTFSNGEFQNGIMRTTYGAIDFNNGVFNNGLVDGSVTWYNGTFNGGEFSGDSKWKNGTFNGGQFTSTYGYALSNSPNQYDYAWENGIFNGGNFGKGEVSMTGSTWFTGEFNGGTFRGKVWNSGIFTNGEFYGSGATAYSLSTSDTYTYGTGSTKYTDLERNRLLSTQTDLCKSYVDSFSNEYYGLWRDGWVIDDKYTILENDEYFTKKELVNKAIKKKKKSESFFKGVLWQNGTFSHKTGTMDQSIFLQGSFDNGTFKNSSFNPYVYRSAYGTYSFELSDSCKWINGDLYDSNFFVSKWENGTFHSGNSFGANWYNGDWMNGRAINMNWKNGTWYNGEWMGSHFRVIDVCTLTGSNTYYKFNDGPEKWIILNNMIDYYNEGCLPYGTTANGYHIWGAFSSTNSTNAGTTYSSINNTIQYFNMDTATPSLATNFTFSASGWANTKQVQIYNKELSIFNKVSVWDYENSYTKIGNGRFKYGLWKNGIWNNGQRIDEDIIIIGSQSYPRLFRTVDYYQSNGESLIGKKYKSNEWIFDISGLTTSSVDGIQVGDYVSVGNIGLLDINGNRRFNKDTYLIEDIKDNDYDTKTLSIKFKANFPLREVNKDSYDDLFSPEHYIYVSKNIWRDGLFLNGIFTGIWNNGTTRTTNNLTRFEDTQWVDGIFDGGHFISRSKDVFDTYYASYDEGVPIAGTFSYNSGLIQNFDFVDKWTTYYISSGANYTPFAAAYESHIDTLYYTYSRTNLYSDTITPKIISSITLAKQPGTTVRTTFDLNVNDTYGDITPDVLSSNSSIKMTKYNGSKDFALGTKFKVYNDELEQHSIFNNSYIQQNGWEYVEYNTLFKESLTTPQSNIKTVDFVLGPSYSTSEIDMSITLGIFDKSKGSKYTKKTFTSKFNGNPLETFYNLIPMINELDELDAYKVEFGGKIRVSAKSNNYTFTVIAFYPSATQSGIQIAPGGDYEEVSYISKTQSASNKIDISQGVSYLDNKFINIEKNRYTIASFYLDGPSVATMSTPNSPYVNGEHTIINMGYSATGGTGVTSRREAHKSLTFLDVNNLFSDYATSSMSITNPLNDNIDHGLTWTPNSFDNNTGKKFEFFYNRTEFNLKTTVPNNISSYSISDIKFEQVDMIPFFKYYSSDSKISNYISPAKYGYAPNMSSDSNVNVESVSTIYNDSLKFRTYQLVKYPPIFFDNEIV